MEQLLNTPVAKIFLFIAGVYILGYMFCLGVELSHFWDHRESDMRKYMDTPRELALSCLAWPLFLVTIIPCAISDLSFYYKRHVSRRNYNS